MPTTRFIDDNLTFLPAQQWIVQTPHLSAIPTPHLSAIPVPSNLQGGASSHGGSSSESEISAPETFHEISQSPMRSPDTTTRDATGGPFLQLVEPPVESIRFRYPTEMKGTHGSILGISTAKKENAKKKIFPSVKINNYTPSVPNEKTIIRCTITTADEDVTKRIPHVHNLKGKGRILSKNDMKTVEIDDPIDIVVYPPEYQATYSNLTILFNKKKEQLIELVKKKKRHICKMFTTPVVNLGSFLEENRLMEDAKRDNSSINTDRLMNTACLKFEALKVIPGHPQYESICPPIYSQPIKNIKSAKFNDLRICRIDKVVGTCLGRDEVFIFVDKVNKKDIKVRFFELDERGDEVWSDDAEFSEEDVHFQYAIAFRTPRYRNVDINSNVQVYFQLLRPTDGSTSTPKEFEYTPDPKRWQEMVRKRPRLESPPIPVSVTDVSRSSTSASLWNPASLTRITPQPLVSPSSLGSDISSPMVTGSDSSSGMDHNEENLSEVFQELFKDTYIHLDLGDWTGDLLELEEQSCEAGGAIRVNPPALVEQEGMSSIISNSNSSVSLSSFPSGNSDKISEQIRQFISNPEVMERYAMANNFPPAVAQQLRQELLEKDYMVTDGGAVQHQMENNEVPRCSNVHPQMGSYTTSMDVEAQGERGSPIPRSNIATHQLATNKMDLGGKNRVQNKRDAKLTRDNIVTNVDKIILNLLKLKVNRKLKESFLKRILITIFATPVEQSEDRVLHVLASQVDFPPEMLRFLNILNSSGITRAVIDLQNINGQTALHVAAEKGSLQTIALLVDSGADVNARDLHLNTPLHLVASRDQNDTYHAAGHILEKNPDLTIYNDEGLTALHVLVLKRKTEAISSLIIKHEDQIAGVGSIINQTDRKQGNTALHFAVQKRFREIVNLLVNFEDQIDVNIKNFEDKTPLAYVVGESDEISRDIEKLLMSNNADPSLVSKKKTETKKNDELKDETDFEDDEVEEVVDETQSAYALEWNSDAELKLLDKKTITEICPILDETKYWRRLLRQFKFDDETFFVLKNKWSPALFLLKAIAKDLPNVTTEDVRDELIKLKNPDCTRAAQLIDDMIMSNIGML